MLAANGKIVQVTSDDNYYKMSFSVEDFLMGTMSSNKIEVVSRFKNGFRLEAEPYLEEGREYILFLNNTIGEWAITSRIAGVYRSDAVQDVKKVINAFVVQKNIFEKENCKKLIDLYDNLDNEPIKNILLLDIEENITAKEIGFIKKMFAKSDSKSKIFGIRNSGKLKIKEMHEPIKAALIAESNTENNFEYLFALENYADKNDAKIAAKYLNDKAQGIRSAAINVLRKIGTEEIIEPLINNYKVEPNWSNRIEILDALKKFKNDDRVIKAVDDFLAWENNEVVKNYLLTIAKNE
ncbi:MAG: HEAT repeat domain-containing protein [Bacteroidota bacterium]